MSTMTWSFPLFLLFSSVLLASDGARADWTSLERTLAEEPNVSDITGAFHGGLSRGEHGRLESGLLACRLSVDASELWDAFRGPDLLLRMRFGADRERWRAADCNRYVALVSIPGVQVAVGQRVSARLEDRDAFGNELITTLTTVWDGSLPLRLANERGSVECRLVPAAIVDAQSRPLLDGVTRDVAALASARFHADDDSLGLPRERMLAGEDKLASLSAWRGRNHADVTAARVQLSGASEDANERVRNGLRKHLAALPTSLTWTRLGSLSVRASDLECNDGAAACFVVLELKNEGNRSLQVTTSPWLATALVVNSVTRDGSVDRLSLDAATLTLAAGAGSSLRVPLRSAYGGAPVALRVTRGGSRAWLRLP